MSTDNEAPKAFAASDQHFETTRWSMVLAAGHRSSPDANRALESLCEAYWYPLYVYVRRRVADVDEAQDLTQAFFAELLAKNFVGSAKADRGRFRAFLLTALKDRRINKCRRFGGKLVESPGCALRSFQSRTEAKDGIPVCSGVCARGGRARTGILPDVVGEGSAAVRGGGGAAAGTRWRGVCRWGV